jgi:hypothetical protein
MVGSAVSESAATPRQERPAWARAILAGDLATERRGGPAAKADNEKSSEAPRGPES